MIDSMKRRELLKLAGIGGVVFASGLAGFAARAVASGIAPRMLPAAIGTAPTVGEDFFFIQMSDSHWGYSGPANLDAQGTLPKAVEAINQLSVMPDFIIFTGDLTHNTDDPFERRRRLREFQQIVGKLKVKTLHLMPGEHDAGLDGGDAYREIFGPTHYTFDHKGVHFIALDNVSDPRGMGAAQLAWLKTHLDTLDRSAQIVVFSHRPLFDLFPAWEWATRDGMQAIDLLMPFEKVTVFYGHIHQENHHMTGHIAHHSAKSLIFPLPAPGSKPKPKPADWDAAHPYRGLGFRGIKDQSATAAVEISEYGVAGNTIGANSAPGGGPA